MHHVLDFVEKLYHPVKISSNEDQSLMIQQMQIIPVIQNTSSFYSQCEEKSLKSRPFTCSECHKSFTQKHVLYDHFRIHTGEKPFVCNFCKRGFRQKNNLKRHIKNSIWKMMKEKTYECPFCKSTFAYYSLLKRHLRTHTGERPFACGVCQMTFKQREHLKRHFLCHSR